MRVDRQEKVIEKGDDKNRYTDCCVLQPVNRCFAHYCMYYSQGIVVFFSK